VAAAQAGELTAPFARTRGGCDTPAPVTSTATDTRSAAPRHLAHVDGLRAIAVVGVVLFHLDVHLFRGGFAGVDVFLVISGFLITRLILDEIAATGGFSFGRFYLRRVRRLGPALVATLLFTALLAPVLLPGPALGRFGDEVLAALGSYSNIFYWLQAGYFDTASRLKPLLHTWSLSVEEQFYLVWPATLLLLTKARSSRVLGGAVLVLAALSLALNFPFGRGLGGQSAFASAFANGKPTIYFLMPFRLFEFAFGAALVATRRWPSRSPLAEDINVVVGLALVLASFVALREGLLFPGWYALLPCVGTFLLIQSGDRSRLRGFLENRWFARIGLVSYSLYLVHWPLTVFARCIAGGADAALGVPLQLAVVVLSALLAIASYRFVEQPFREGRIRLRWLAVPTGAVLALGAYTILSDGWAWRNPVGLPSEVTRLSGDFHRTYYGGAGFSRSRTVSDGTPDIVLAGDSHGLHYAFGLSEELVKPNGWKLAVHAGTSCLNLPGFTRIGTEYDWDTVCPSAVEKLRAAVGSDGVPPVVVLSHSWVNQMAKAARLGAVEAGPVTAEEVAAGIKALRTELRDCELVVFGCVPGAGGVDLADELTTAPLLRRRAPSEVLAPKPAPEEAVAINRSLRAALEGSGIVFLDPSDALREGDGFAVADAENFPLYSDASHLSVRGSRRVVRHFADEIRACVERSRAARSRAALSPTMR